MAGGKKGVRLNLTPIVTNKKFKRTRRADKALRKPPPRPRFKRRTWGTLRLSVLATRSAVIFPSTILMSPEVRKKDGKVNSPLQEAEKKDASALQRRG